MLGRREFLLSMAAAAASQPWGCPVLDIHLHPRRGSDREMDHLTGAGITRAVLLPGAGTEERAKGLVDSDGGHFARFTNADVRQDAAVGQMRNALQHGAIGMGELKYPVEIDGPEMRRVYELAAELQVPVLMHYQEGAFNSGIRRLPTMLKAYPKTVFIAHANSWWANISAEVNDRVDYPTGPIKPGGLTDKLLSDYPNIYGDLSADSGRNALARDPEYAAAFLERHRAKLMFGSDCPCKDGHGAGQVGPVGNKCMARETLTMMKKYVSPAIFRQIAWENGNRLLRLS